MLHNNLAQEQAALQCAQRAADYYAQTSDRRALIRVLSQVAQINSRLGRYDAAKAPAAAAIREARALGNDELLVSVLRRCAFALPEAAKDEARSYFSEALDLARSQNNVDEQSRILHWWAYRESAWGNMERAFELALEGLRNADRDTRMHLENQLSTYALALGQVDALAAHAWRALELAREAHHQTLFTLALAFCAPLTADAAQAAMLLGHARARLLRLNFEPQQDDRQALRAAETIISAKLPDGAFEPLCECGAQWTDDQALAALNETQHAGG